MAFTFNWAGLKPQQITPYDNSANLRADMENLGKGMWGMQKRAADTEYAKMLEERSGAMTKMDEIVAEISRLEARNEEIRAKLSGMAPAPTQVAPNTVPEPPQNMGYPQGFRPWEMADVDVNM